jgi:hypothetical protein
MFGINFILSKSGIHKISLLFFGGIIVEVINHELVNHELLAGIV